MEKWATRSVCEEWDRKTNTERQKIAKDEANWRWRQEKRKTPINFRFRSCIAGMSSNVMDKETHSWNFCKTLDSDQPSQPPSLKSQKFCCSKKFAKKWSFRFSFDNEANYRQKNKNYQFDFKDRELKISLQLIEFLHYKKCVRYKYYWFKWQI